VGGHGRGDATASAPRVPSRRMSDADASRDATPQVVPVDLRDYVDFSRDAATRVRVFATDQLALDLWCLEPQQATPVLHLPDRDVTYTVIGGRSWFVTDDGEVGLDPMGALLVPAGVVHGIDNRAPDPLIVIAAVAPPGDEAPAAPTATDGEAIRPEPGPGPLARAWRRVLGG
jgi:quercetin dioxygenase-like cupin family protein